MQQVPHKNSIYSWHTTKSSATCPIWSNQQKTKHSSFSKWWICYEDCLIFSSSIILNLKMASSPSIGIRWSKRLFNLKTCLFPLHDDWSACVCTKMFVKCDHVCIVYWISPYIICCTSLNFMQGRSEHV